MYPQSQPTYYAGPAPAPEPKTAKHYYHVVSAPEPKPAALYHYVVPAPEPAKPAAEAYWYGSTKEEVDTQNHAIITANAAAKPIQLVPYEPSPEQQFYCREHDGSYTLRTGREIGEDCQPGHWQYGDAGYPYFIRG